MARYNHIDSTTSPSRFPPKQNHSSLISFSCCFRGPGDEDELPSPPSLIKQRCLRLVYRIGKHRRRHTGDFAYDSFNYSLNFDDGEDANEVHYQNFSSRLPRSPPPPSVIRTIL